jgi:MFS family permease
MTIDSPQSDHLRRLASTILLISFPFGLLFFALPILGREMGASALTIAGLYSAFSLMTVVLRPLVGWALDRHGRRPFLLGGLAGYLVANLAFLWARSITALYVARIAQSIGSSLTWLAAYAIVADVSAKKERGRSYGRLEQSSSQAIIVGIVLFFFIYGTVSEVWAHPSMDPFDVAWMMSFGIFALLGVLAIVRIRGLAETSRTRSATPFGAWIRESWVRQSRPLLILMGIVFLTTAAVQAVSPLVLIFLQDRFGASMRDLALAYAPMALIWALVPSRMGTVADRVGRKLPMALGLLVSGAVTLVLPHATSLVLLAILWAIEALAFTASVPAEEALVADLSGGETHGEAFGLYTFASGLGAVAGPLAGGWLYDHAGHRVPFYFTAGLVFAGAALILLLVCEPS